MSPSSARNSKRVPVFCGLLCIELADPSRVKRILQAPNAKAIRRHKDRQVVEIQLTERGNDTQERSRRGNPLRYSSDRETAENPQNVWNLKRIPKKTRPLFLAVLKDCAA